MVVHLHQADCGFANQVIGAKSVFVPHFNLQLVGASVESQGLSPCGIGALAFVSRMFLLADNADNVWILLPVIITIFPMVSVSLLM